MNSTPDLIVGATYRMRRQLKGYTWKWMRIDRIDSDGVVTLTRENLSGVGVDRASIYRMQTWIKENHTLDKPHIINEFYS